MPINLAATGGRYPAGLSPYRLENIRAVLEVKPDSIRLRIDDIENIDAWQEFIIDRGDLEESLRRTPTNQSKNQM